MGFTFAGDVPGLQQETAQLDAVDAADATESQTIFVAPYRVRLKAVRITPDASVTGDDTDRKNLNVINKGTDGSGSTELGALDLATGTDLTAFDQTDIASGLNTDLAKGTVLALEVEKVGSGVALPQSRIEVEYVSSELAQTS